VPDRPQNGRRHRATDSAKQGSPFPDPGPPDAPRDPLMLGRAEQVVDVPLGHCLIDHASSFSARGYGSEADEAVLLDTGTV
jgi:hypothetical protein